MSLTITQWTNTGLLPTSGLEAWHQYDPDYGLLNSVIYDYSGHSRDLASTGAHDPIATANVINGQPGWYFNGTNTTPLKWTGALNPKHVFILASAQESTFPSYRGLLSGVTAGDALTSNNSGTKFFDFGLGSAYAYRKNDVSYANSNLQAPMSGAMGLMEIQSSSGLGFDGIQIGLQRNLAGRIWKGYFVEQLIYSRVLTTAERKRVMLYFNLKFKQYNAGLPLYFPSDDFVPYKRRRFYAEPPMYSKITDSFEFEDGGKTFNEVADVAPRRWEYNYKFNNSAASTDPYEVRLFDEFNDAVRMSTPFNFTDKYGTVWDNVRIEGYDRDHSAHKAWSQEIKFRLIRYPN
jgi:hypothetical protein